MILLNNEIDAKLEDKNGRNPLFHFYDNNYKWYGLKYGYLVYGEVTDLLIQRGVDINATDKDGINILHSICDKSTEKGLVEMISTLIKKGIQIHSIDRKGFNALHYLCNRDWKFVKKETELLFSSAKLLIRNGIFDLDLGPSTSQRESFFYLFSYFKEREFTIDQVELTSFKSYINDFVVSPTLNNVGTIST